jgi:hypothetical protein
MGAGHAVLHLYGVSLMQLGGRVSARRHGVKPGLPGHTGNAYSQLPLLRLHKSHW